MEGGGAQPIVSLARPHMHRMLMHGNLFGDKSNGLPLLGRTQQFPIVPGVHEVSCKAGTRLADRAAILFLAFALFLMTSVLPKANQIPEASANL